MSEAPQPCRPEPPQIRSPEALQPRIPAAPQTRSPAFPQTRSPAFPHSRSTAFCLAALICEPAHFSGINSRIELQERGIRCERIAFQASPENPHFQAASATCTFQSEPRLFSCAGGKANVMRLCPCRDAMPGQSALCANCLSP